MTLVEYPVLSPPPLSCKTVNYFDNYVNLLIVKLEAIKTMKLGRTQTCQYAKEMYVLEWS